MSTTFNPTKKPVNPFERNFLGKEERARAGGFWANWFQAVRAGQEAERYPPLEYCQRSWAHQTGLSPDQAPREFLEPCIASHELFMRFVRWHRLN